MPEIQEQIKEELVIKTPETYEIVLFDNSRTTMEGVVLLLIKVFDTPNEMAHLLMMSIHAYGSGVAFEGPHDVAVELLKVAQDWCLNYPDEILGLRFLRMELRKS